MRPNQQFANAGSILSTKNSNSFRIVGLNPSELKKNPIPAEDFSQFEEKSNFQKALVKLKNRVEEKPGKKNEESSDTRSDYSRSKSKLPRPSPLKRCLSYKNPEQSKKNAEQTKTPQKRKSEMLFGEGFAEGQIEKIQISVKNRGVKKKITPLPTASTNNFNITITNVNNNIVIPSGQALNLNLVSNNSPKADSNRKSSMDNSINLLSPHLTRQKSKKGPENENLPKINETSIEILKRQNSIHPILIKTKTPHNNDSSPFKNSKDVSVAQSQSRLPSQKDIEFEEFVKNSEKHRVFFFFFFFIQRKYFTKFS